MRAAIVFVTLAVLGVAGCSTGGEPGPEPEVVLFSRFVGAEGERFDELLAHVEETTGVRVRHVATGDLEADLVERIQVGETPDIALVTEAGLVQELVEAGAVEQFPDELAGELLTALPEGVEEELADDGGLYAGLVRVVVKGLVWYRPDVFEEYGFEVPETWDDLEALVDEMAEVDPVAWCVGLAAGRASGWPGVDWIEAVLLRHQGTELYDAWANGEVQFGDSDVRQAWEDARDLVLRNPTNAGLPREVLARPVHEAQEGLLGDEPDCLLHEQASFARAWLPEDVDIGPDGDLDVFLLPDTDGGSTVIVGADLVVAFDDRPEVWSVVEALLGPGAARSWEGDGGVGPLGRGATPDDYDDPFERRLAQMLVDAEPLRYDASDQMPPAVGVKAFAEGVLELVRGSDLDQILDDVDDTWSDRLLEAER